MAFCAEVLRCCAALALLAASASAQAAQPTAADTASRDAAGTEKATPWRVWLEREEPPSVEAEPESGWYGWQTLLVDGFSFVLGVAAAPLSGVGFFVGTAALVFGAPIVHFVHGNVAYGLISFGIRALAGGFFWAAVIQAHGDQESSNELAALSGVTIAAAIVLDSAALGWESSASQPAAFAPFFDPVHGRAGLSYAGTF